MDPRYFGNNLVQTHLDSFNRENRAAENEYYRRHEFGWIEGLTTGLKRFRILVAMLLI